MKDIQDTTREAYAAALEKLPEIQRACLIQLQQESPLTCTELSARTGYVIDNIRPAITHLKDAGLVYKTDVRRATKYGKPSIAWALKFPPGLLS